MITKLMGDIMVLYPTITCFYFSMWLDYLLWILAFF